MKMVKLLIQAPRPIKAKLDAMQEFADRYIRASG